VSRWLSSVISAYLVAVATNASSLRSPASCTIAATLALSSLTSVIHRPDAAGGGTNDRPCASTQPSSSR
jgi:hypothetical protein